MSATDQTSSPAVNMRVVYLLTAVAALGGLLFGYDTAVIAGAIGFLQTKFELTAAMKGWAASSAIIGCIFGAMFAGYMSDRYGRKRILILTALLFGLSAVGSAIPSNLTQFAVARFIGGLGVGAASMLSPLYITELAPAKIRGQLVSLYQLAIVLGILLIFFINMLVQNQGDEAWNVEYGWRYMLGSETIPAVLFFFAMFFVPESPRWLAKEKQDEAAVKVLARINGAEKAREILLEIKATLLEESGTLRELFSGRFRKSIIIGILLALFTQFQGINAIMYYAPEIFKAVGVGQNSAFAQTVIVGVINVLFTFVAIWLVDRVGRKALLLVGGAGMGVSLFMVGAAFHFGWGGYFPLVFILSYVACFAASFGPVPWVILSEIFPIKLRGLAMSVGTLAVWVAVYFVTQLFPIMVEAIGQAYTFWIFFVVSVLAFGFVWRMIPETKEKTLEEIERSWH
ncbi:MAG: sugar porter family MFS transporter [Phaeodactylibacter sp.]|nr:sugar porter family MFS transporter [Phaeodactylibacter sp.]MCB9276171.1 sugar porter family MFS transporter [Lewinellaceae bacterium]